MSTSQAARPAYLKAASSSVAPSLKLSCSECSKIFRTLPLLQKHQRRRRELGSCQRTKRVRSVPPEGLACLSCHESFDNPASLYKHTTRRRELGRCPARRQHATASSSIKCSVCDISFTAKTTLAKHNRLRVERGFCPIPNRFRKAPLAGKGPDPTDQEPTSGTGKATQDPLPQSVGLNDSSNPTTVPAPSASATITARPSTRKWQCVACPTALGTRGSLYRHVKKSMEQGFCPPPIGKRLRGIYEDADAMAPILHGRTDLALALGPIQCEYCGVIFNTEDSLKSHGRKRRIRGECPPVNRITKLGMLKLK